MTGSQVTATVALCRELTRKNPRSGVSRMFQLQGGDRKGSCSSIRAMAASAVATDEHDEVDAIEEEPSVPIRLSKDEAIRVM